MDAEKKLRDVDEKALFEAAVDLDLAAKPSLEMCLEIKKDQPETSLWDLFVQQGYASRSDAERVLEVIEKSTQDPTRPQNSPSEEEKKPALAPGDTEQLGSNSHPPQSTVPFMTRPSDLVGEKVGKYEIRSLVGKGGMAYVYEGWDPVLERRVAIKMLTQVLAVNEKYRRRFIQEAKVLAKVEHPNVVSIYDFGEYSDTMYIAFKYIDGPSLEKTIKEEEKISLERVLNILRDVASGLWEVHKRGIIHRDIKPSNLMVDTEGRAILTDFGIAYSNQKDISQSGRSLGTPLYMAPEVFQGQDINEKSDIYSLGVTAYYMLSGRRPFSADAPYEIIRKHVSGDYVPLDQVINISSEVSRLIQSMMEKDPSQRPKDMETVFNQIEEIIENLGKKGGLSALLSLKSSTSSGGAKKSGDGSSSSQKALIRVATVIVSCLLVYVVYDIIVSVKFNKDRAQKQSEVGSLAQKELKDTTLSVPRTNFLAAQAEVSRLLRLGKLYEAEKVLSNMKDTYSGESVYRRDLGNWQKIVDKQRTSLWNQFNKVDKKGRFYIRENLLSKAEEIYSPFAEYDLPRVKKKLEKRIQLIQRKKAIQLQEAQDRAQLYASQRKLEKAVEALIPYLQSNQDNIRNKAQQKLESLFVEAQKEIDKLRRQRKFQSALGMYKPFLDLEEPILNERIQQGIQAIYTSYEAVVSRFAAKYRTSADWENSGDYEQAITIMRETLNGPPQTAKIASQRISILQEVIDKLPANTQMVYGSFEEYDGMVKMSNGVRYSHQNRLKPVIDQLSLGTPLLLWVNTNTRTITKIQKSSVATLQSHSFRYKEPFQLLTDEENLAFYISHTAFDLLVFTSEFSPSVTSLPKLKIIPWTKVKAIRRY